MRLEAPPSRYRVIERGGRLVVIDSVAGGAPLTARDLLPDDGDAYSRQSYSRDGGDPEPPATPPVILDSRPHGNMASPRPSLTPEPSGALANVAATITGGARDDQGRLLLTTARWYDARAPRALALSEAGERQLGGAVLALAAAAIVAALLVVMGNVVGWMIVFAAFFLAARAKPLTTAWVDRLADV